jgi:hypothetical protein
MTHMNMRTISRNLSLQEPLFAEIKDSAEKCTRRIVIGVCKKFLEDEGMEKALRSAFHKVGQNKMSANADSVFMPIHGMRLARLHDALGKNEY